MGNHLSASFLLSKPESLSLFRIQRGPKTSTLIAIHPLMNAADLKRGLKYSHTTHVLSVVLLSPTKHNTLLIRSPGLRTQDTDLVVKKRPQRIHLMQKLSYVALVSSMPFCAIVIKKPFNISLYLLIQWFASLNTSVKVCSKTIGSQHRNVA